MSQRASNDPLVSIITPAYNCANFISEAIRSVFAQTYANWEYIIIDDGSSDDTSDVIRAYCRQDARIILLTQEKNGGPGAARNRGIEQARGRFIAFLDSDDLWLPQKLEEQVAFMKNRCAALSYTNFQRINEKNGLLIGNVKCPETLTESDFMKSNQIACSTAMYDASMTGKILMPLIRKRQDWGLWLKITKMGFVGLNVGQTLVRYRVRSGSVSGNKVVALFYTWRFFKEVAKIPFYRRCYLLMYYTAFNAKKYRVAAKSVRKI